MADHTKLIDNLVVAYKKLPRECQKSFGTCLMCLNLEDDPEEVGSIKEAMVEILENKPLTSRPLPETTSTPCKS